MQIRFKNMLRRSLSAAALRSLNVRSALRTVHGNARRLGANATFSTGRSAPSGPSASGTAASEAGSGYYSARARANAALEGFALPHSISREELHRIMNETLQNRSRKFALSAAAGTAVVALVAYYYRKEGRAAVVEEISDVASRSLSDQKMQAQAQLVTIQTLQALLAHSETVHRTVAFLSQVSEHEQTREAVVNLLVTALKNPAVLEEALQLVLWILDDSRARENLVTCLISALTNPRFEAAAAEFAVRWLADESVSNKVSEVFKDASLTVLEEDTVRENAEQFVQGLLQEPQLQAKTSEHLWGAVKGLIYSPKPKPVPAVGTMVAPPSPAANGRATPRRDVATAPATAEHNGHQADARAAKETSPAAAKARATSSHFLESAEPTAAIPASGVQAETTKGGEAGAEAATATAVAPFPAPPVDTDAPSEHAPLERMSAERGVVHARGPSATHLKRASSDSMPDVMITGAAPSGADASTVVKAAGEGTGMNFSGGGEGGSREAAFTIGPVVRG